MATLLDRHRDTVHTVLCGAAEIEETLDRMLTATSIPFEAGDCAAAVQALERIGRRVEAAKLKVVAAADRTGVATDAGFTGTEAWVARQTTTSRTSAAREVALAIQLGSGGHDATAAALDEGLVSSAHAAVILRAGNDLPAGVSDAQRQQVEAAPGGEGAALRPRPAAPDRPPRSGASRRRSRGVTNEQEERSGGCSAWDASAPPPAFAGVRKIDLL